MNTPQPRPSADYFVRVQETTIWRDLHAAMAAALPAPTGHARALDIGCGPGLLCDLLARRGWTVTGVDVGEDMLTLARARHPNLTFELGDAYDLTAFGAETWQLVVASNLLFFLPDPLVVVRELVRACAPGGLVAMLNPSPDLNVARATELGHELALPEWDRMVLRNWARLAELNGAFDEELASAMFQLADLDELRYQRIGPAGIGALMVGRRPSGSS